MKKMSASSRVFMFAASISLLLLLTACEVNAKASKALVKEDRKDQIMYWENKIQHLRNNKMSKSLSKLICAQTSLEEAKKRQGFFHTSPELKATINALDEDFSRSLAELEKVKKEEGSILAELKPLYGVLSTQFIQEQKNSIAESISVVQKMSYDNAWYSSIFNIFQGDSMTEIITGFILQWIMSYIILYPFAVLYYALWQAPWSVYAYCASASDWLIALLAYFVSVTVMSLPLLVLLGGFFVVNKYPHVIRRLFSKIQRRSRLHQI